MPRLISLLALVAIVALTLSVGSAQTTRRTFLPVIYRNATTSGIVPRPVAPPIDPYKAATRAAMPTGRTGLAAGTAANGRVYAIGGTNSSDPNSGLNTVEEYDPVADGWRGRAPMPTRRHQLGGGVLGGHLFAIGGTGPQFFGAAQAVQEYDPDADSWIGRAPMRNLHIGLGVAPGPNGYLYAVGGISGGVFGGQPCGDPSYRPVEEYHR